MRKMDGVLLGVRVLRAAALGAFVGGSVLLGDVAFAKNASAVDLVKACKKECPGAKTNESAHACIESKESDPAFKKTGCYLQHKDYEAAQKKHAHDEHSGEDSHAH